MTELKSRLKEARRLANKTQAEVAEAVGMKQPSYQQLESGKANASTFLTLIADFLGVDALWLQTGVTKDESALSTTGNVIPVSEELLQKRHDVPLLTWVSAGAWLQNHGSFSSKDAERWLPCPVPHSIMTFVLEVEGDSMTSPYPNEKSYPHGTLIYVDPERPIANRCRVVAYLEKKEAYTFKRYVEDAGKKYLKPINPSYETIELTDEIRICGVVIGSFSDD